VNTAKFLINNSSDNEELDPEQRELIRQQDLERLAMMVGYCKTKECQRGYILDYFGQNHRPNCGNCGNCKGEFEPVDITREAQMILSCVRRIYDRLGYHVGVATVARVLSGSKEKKLFQLGLDQLSTYGLLKNRPRNEIRAMAEHLESLGYLFTEPEHQTLELTSKSARVLYHGEKVEMLVQKEPEVPEGTAPAVKLTGAEADLYDTLRELRAQLAREANVPAYVVFSNATLQDMAQKKPLTLMDFKKVSGVGELKTNWYGKAFTQCIRQYLSEGAE
jgi:ATP-dependent DNA helicase RecQ